MGVAYYPVQQVSFGGTTIKGAQTASIDFDSKKTEFYQFGTENRIGYASLECPSVNAKIQYVLNKNASNSSLYGDFLSKSSSYKTCQLKFLNGKMDLTSGEIVGYSLKAQVGSIVTAEIDVLGLNASYASIPQISPSSPNPTGVSTAPNLSIGQEALKSFNININIPKKIVYSIGNGPELINFRNPKIFMELEYILGVSAPNLLNKSAQINCDGVVLFETNNLDLKMIRHSTQNSISDVGTTRVSYEAEINDSSNILINY